MAKKPKTPRTIIPIADKAATGKNSRLPKEPKPGDNIFGWRGRSKFHD